MDFSPEGPAPIDLWDLNPPEIVPAIYRYSGSWIQERPRATVHRYVLEAEAEDEDDGDLPDDPTVT